LLGKGIPESPIEDRTERVASAPIEEFSMTYRFAKYPFAKYPFALAAFLLAASPAFAVDANDTARQWRTASAHDQRRAAQQWADNLNKKFGSHFKNGRRVKAGELQSCITAKAAAGHDTDTQLNRLAAQCAVQQVGSIY